MAKDFIGEQGVIQTAARTFDFSDESGIGSDDGTPIKADMVMQLHAVTQKLMIDAGDTFNGVQENAVSQTPGDQQIFDALVSKINTLVQNAASLNPTENLIVKRNQNGVGFGQLPAGVESPENYSLGRYALANLDHLNSRAIPIGTILPFGSATVPAGWFECNGADVSRTSYPLLFAAIGTTWGSGDGSTTFTLPDLRNRMLAGEFQSASSGQYFIRPDGNTYTTQILTGQYTSAASGLQRYIAGVKFMIRAL